MAEKQIIEEIKEYDPNFQKGEFKRWCRLVLEKLQEAWTNKDLVTLKAHEVKELYQLHEKQLQAMKAQDIINVTKDMEIDEVEIKDYNRLTNHEIFDVTMKVTLIDYYQEEKSGRILSGRQNQKVTAIYEIEVEREKNFLSEWLVDKSINECPYCGAPINPAKEKQCEYCQRMFITMDNSYKIKSIKI